MAVFVGMLGAAAMATQNAVVRLALPGHPTTAVMSTNAAQLAVDLAMLARCLLWFADFPTAEASRFYACFYVLLETRSALGRPQLANNDFLKISCSCEDPSRRMATVEKP